MDENNVLIESKNARFGYGREIVLNDVNLQVPKGVFWPIVGPNGAGKTTLLRGLCGLLKPQAGIVKRHLNGQPIGYVPQGWKLDPIYPLTVGEVVLQGRFAYQPWHKRPSKEDCEIARDALKEVNLDNVWTKNWRDLSGGMKQKVLIARALTYASDLICLDEPTSEVDKPSEINILKHLYRLHEEKNLSVLIVCHAIGAIFDFAKSCLLVDRKEIQFVQENNISIVKEQYV